MDESTNEGRIIAGILDVLSEMNEYLVEIDDDLAMLLRGKQAVDALTHIRFGIITRDDEGY